MTSVIPIIAVLLASMTFSASVTLPQRRSFLPLRGTLDLTPDSLTLRVQQFNVLADGLSGARKDLGGFVRATPEILAWENRREPLLHEITQYGADVVTMQECDHFNDFFQPRMRELGYVGYFAAKPTSGCLDVSDNADGCALFVKESKFRVISCESKSLALSIAKLKEGELEEDETSISQQNQIAIIAVIEFINYKGKKEQQQPRVYNSDADYERMFEEKPEDDVLPGSNDKDVPPPIIVSTAHLKSSKTATGERFRQKAMLKILTEVERVAMDFGRKGRPPAVLIAADLNADAKPAPDQSKVFGSLRGTYAPLTWNAARMHRLAMKSVYHDDISSIIRITNNSNNNNKDKGGEGSSIEIPAMQAYLPSVSPEEVYTTWKYRGSKQQRERGGRDGEGAREVRRHIDYILYTPFRRGPPNPALGRGSRRILGGGIRYNKVSGGGGSSINITPASTTSTSTSSSSSSSSSSSNSNTKKKSSSVVATKSDQLVISVLLRIAVYTFGSVIPLAAVIDSNLSTMEKVVVGVLGLIGLLVFETSSRGTIFKPEIEEEVVIESIYNEVRPDAYRVDGQSTAGIAISESKRQGRQLLNGIRRVSKIIQTEAYGRPGLQPLAVLDLYGPETVGVEAGLLPSAHYPSDHLSIAADFQLRWEK